MSRGARHLGRFLGCDVWYFASAGDARRVYPRRMRDVPSAQGHWIDILNILVRVEPGFGVADDSYMPVGATLDDVCTGRAAQVLRGRYHHAGGGL